MQQAWPCLFVCLIPIVSRAFSFVQCKHCVAVWLALAMEKHQTTEHPYNINTRTIPDEAIAMALCRES